MPATTLLGLFEQYGDWTAIISRDRPCSYRELRQLSLQWIEDLDLPEGSVVSLYGDYSPQSVALLLALLQRGHVVCPLTSGFDRQKDELYEVAQVSAEIVIDDDDQVRFVDVGHQVDHPLLLSLRGSCGLVLFSSGATGKSKAVVHDGRRLLEKFATPRRPKVTIPFMLFDHIGGINTVLHALCSGGTAVIAPDRSPATICRLVEAHGVQVLPTSPTFVNLLLLGDHDAHDLSSLEILAYGAERMPEASLARLAAAFPDVKLIQNYGLSEVGIMRTKSESNDSLWVKLGGDGFETRVRDGLLEIKSKTAMVGYLNAESPFTEDGWVKTGDRVETRGEYFRILGRQSDIIIIGGEKVYPAEVEDLISTMPDVLDVVVSKEANAITGNIVKAQVQLATDEKRSAFRKRMAAFLKDRLAPFKIPQKVQVTQSALHNARFKKERK